MTRSIAIGLAVAVAAGGCGGSERTARTAPGDRPAAVELAPLPPGAVRRCAELAPRRDIPVLCPRRLTPGRWHVRYQTLRQGRREYLSNLETRPTGSGEAFHALAGGRAGRFPLATTARGLWPRAAPLARDLGLVGARPLEPGQRGDEQEPLRLRALRRATVAGGPALVLRVAGYPDGGVHGGHVAVVWNAGSAGYALSLHFSERSELDEDACVDVLLRAAESMARAGAADGAAP